MRKTVGCASLDANKGSRMGKRNTFDMAKLKKTAIAAATLEILLASGSNAFANDGQVDWSCSPADNDQGWICQISPKPPGSRYTLPFTPEPDENARRQLGLTAAETDWVDESDLTEEQQSLKKPRCCGTYIEPTKKENEEPQDLRSAPLKAEADHSELNRDKEASLLGDVLLTQGYRQLRADSIVVNQQKGIARMEGNILVREPGILLVGDSAELNIDDNRAVIEGASFLAHQQHLRGSASSIEKSDDNAIVLNEGRFTQCEPDSNTWYLTGQEITLDPAAGQGKGKHVSVRIKDIPVFYLPYVQFPVGGQRQSGLLFPSFSFGEDGTSIAIPYYFNLAPNYDLTLTPRYMSDRGSMLEAEFRHLSEDFASGIKLGFLSNDKGGSDSDTDNLIRRGVITEEEGYPFRNQDRWLINFEQQGGLSSEWYSEIDFTRVSDEDYFRDLDTANIQVNSNTHLGQSGELGYYGDHWHYSIQAQAYQTIAIDTDTPYRQLPRININGHYQIGRHLTVDLDHEYVYFDHRSDLFEGAPRLTGQRANLNYQATYNYEWRWGHIRPGAGVRNITYAIDDEGLASGVNKTPSVTAAQGSLDLGLYFEREGRLFGSYLQTLEPRAFYFYSDYESHEELFNLTPQGADIDFDTSELTFSYDQLFRTTRFAGGDRIDDDNRLSIGVTSRFINPEDGKEHFRVAIGQTLYFDDRRVFTDEQVSTNRDSDLAAQFAMNLGNWEMSADAVFEDEEGHFVRSSTRVSYNDSDRKLFGFGHHYVKRPSERNELGEKVKRDLEQVDASLWWPLGDSISLIAASRYDFTNDNELETLFGVEYDSCCYSARLLLREWVDNDQLDELSDTELNTDQGIFFEFQLKGLGGLGNKVDGILRDAIEGYDAQEELIK